VVAPNAGSGRKVRAPQGAMPDNVRAGRPDGKWHRKDTARVSDVGQNPAPDIRHPGKGEKAR